MKKTIEINYMVKRKIDYIVLNRDLLAFKESVYINEELFKQKEGLVTKENLSNLKENNPIVGSNYSLYFFEILEFSRNILIFGDKQLIEKFSINNPYSYVLENGTNNVLALFIPYSNHNMCDIHNKRQPKAINFDYIMGGLINNNYDLEEV